MSKKAVCSALFVLGLALSFSFGSVWADEPMKPAPAAGEMKPADKPAKKPAKAKKAKKASKKMETKKMENKADEKPMMPPPQPK